MTAINDELALLGGVPVRPQGPPDWPGDDPAVRESVSRALADGTWGKYHGPHCADLAERLAEYHRCDHVLLCASGTAAVELALRGLEVGAGDEVILAAYDFKGNFQNVLTVGAKPVLVDVADDNWNFDPSWLKSALSQRTRAIIVSHLHGGVVPMSPVVDFARRFDLAVIEDACQMPGAVIEGKLAGTAGDVGIHSFGGSKLLSAGRGGALHTGDAEIAQRIRLYTQRGNEAYPLSELQAAALLPQWEQLNERNARRRRNVIHLQTLLDGIAGIEPFDNGGVEATPGYYKLGMKYDLQQLDGLSRDTFSKALRAEGIAVDVGFRSLHRIHGRRRFRAVGELENADRADECVLTLHHPILLGDENDMQQIAAAIDKVRRHATMIREQRGQESGEQPSTADPKSAERRAVVFRRQRAGISERRLDDENSRSRNMDCAEKFEQGLTYRDFLARYGSDEQRSRWEGFHQTVELTAAQKELLRGFKREMKLMVVAGAWCGDCVNQCPIWDHFAAESPQIQIRYFDRDDNANLADELSMCGGRRVPSVLFLSEDGQPCGRYGDRTLAKYRDMAAGQLGAACPTGIVPPESSLTELVVQDWLDEFERIQLMLRTSPRLRERHGD